MDDKNLDTIFALASARGSAGVSVVRISGNIALNVVQSLCRKKSLLPGKIHLANLYHPKNKQILDQAVILYFAKPGSFTGEDVIELQCHGSSAVLDVVFEALLYLGLRPAEPGEFSRRAFSNGKMDLVQAEGLADLIDARTEGQRQQAVQQMGGNLSQYIESWRSKLLVLLARVEAEIDFSEEEDVTGGLSSLVLPDLQDLESELVAHLALADRGRKVRDGFLIALVGPVNAGKSTLLNALSGEDRAIVSDQPGTTRDVIEAQTQIGGFLVTIADTAGLRETKQKIEQEGIRRTQMTAKTADLRLFLSEGGQKPDNELFDQAQAGDLFLHTKSDLTPNTKPSDGWVSISAKTGLGMEFLQDCLQKEVEKRLCATELPSLTRKRHVYGIKSACGSLVAAKIELERRFDCRPELVAEDLRQCATHLGSLLGELGTEQVLDEVFSSFCIGK